jgi:hypothetical protein
MSLFARILNAISFGTYGRMRAKERELRQHREENFIEQEWLRHE